MTREEQIKAIVKVLIETQDELKYLFSDYHQVWSVRFHGPEPTLESIATSILNALQQGEGAVVRGDSLFASNEGGRG